MTFREQASAFSTDVKSWNNWWVAMWVAIFITLAVTAFVLPFWTWWLLVAILFGIPEFIGARITSDSFPALTNVIVRYIPREIAYPIIFGLAAGVGAYWFGLKHPVGVGLLVGLMGWFIAHFERRYETKEGS